MNKNDIIFNYLQGDSDGWQTTYSYNEVVKAMDLWSTQLLLFLNPLTDQQVKAIFGVTTEYLTSGQIKEKYNIDL